MPKKRVNWFWVIFCSLFIVFVAYIIAYNSGYYEANISRKSKITEEKLQEFEKDVQEGREIDIKEYVETDKKDYSSALSKVGNKLSSSIDSFLDDGLNGFFDFLGKLFT